MSRVRRGFTARRRRKKILVAASGYRGARHRTLRGAIQFLRRGLVYAYRDRRSKKRQFRRLWIAKINAASRAVGLKYSQLICGLKRQGIELDRSVLANLAMTDSRAFNDLAEKAKTALNR